MANSKPQNSNRSRRLPKNSCCLCGELLGDFHPSYNGVLWLDVDTNQHVGWVCPKGCATEDVNDDFDESIAD